MSREDLNTNRAVRSVLVRHWLNLGLLSIRTASGRTALRGALKRIDGIKADLSPSAVEALFAEIRRIPSVHRLHLDISNWRQDGGRWRPHDQAACGESDRKMVKRDSEEPTSRVFDLE